MKKSFTRKLRVRIPPIATSPSEIARKKEAKEILVELQTLQSKKSGKCVHVMNFFKRCFTSK